MNTFTAAVPYAGMLLLAAATFAWFLADAVTGASAQVREWSRRSEDRDVADAFEAYGIAYRAGSPPSHAAGRAA